MGMRAQFRLEKPRFFLKSSVEILQTDSWVLDFFHIVSGETTCFLLGLK